MVAMLQSFLRTKLLHVLDITKYSLMSDVTHTQIKLTGVKSSSP